MPATQHRSSFDSISYGSGIRLMNRLYLAAKLRTEAPRKRKKSGN
jgi:hypothetical protein